MGTVVYILCVMTCIGCSVLLWRAYRKSKLRLLFWSALCFAILAISNGLLFLDLVIFPDLPILTARTITTQAALLVLIYGLIFESNT